MIFKSNYYYYIQLLLLCFLLSSCQTPKYSKVTNITDTSDFLPEVQYTISENFSPKKLSCIAIGKITDASEKNDYKSLDKVLLISSKQLSKILGKKNDNSLRAARSNGTGFKSYKDKQGNIYYNLIEVFNELGIKL